MLMSNPASRTAADHLSWPRSVSGMSGKSVGLRRWIVYGGRLANLGGQAFLPWPLG